MPEASIEISHELRGLLLPVGDSNLLLPNATVVEVLIYPEVTQAEAGSPDWYLGEFIWRHLSLPLVSWEHLSGLAGVIDTQQRKRVAVCHLTGVGNEAHFVGLQTSGMPRLIPVSRKLIQAQADSADDETCVQGELKIEDALAHIPDMKALGQMITELRAE